MAAHNADATPIHRAAREVQLLLPSAIRSARTATPRLHTLHLLHVARTPPFHPIVSASAHHRGKGLVLFLARRDLDLQPLGSCTHFCRFSQR